MDSNNLLFNDSQLDNDDTYFEDINSMYYHEISKYPLLSQEEEVYYAKMLQNPENKKLLVINDIDGYAVANLNIPLLFRSLENSSIYNDAIDSLLSFYNKLNSNNSNEVEKIQEYKNISSRVNRALNSDELKDKFGISDGEKLNEKEILEEIKKYIDYRYGFDKLFISNLRLVVSIAGKYRCNVDLIDLINEGNLGLMKAIVKYDVSLGYRLSTYATHWIRQGIRRYIYNSNSVIRIPENIRNDMLSFRRKVADLEQQEGRSLTNEEISNKLNVLPETVKDYKKFLVDPIYLDEPITDEEDMSMIDVISSGENIEETILQHVLKEEIQSFFETLSEKETAVIKLRYGLCENDDTRYSLLETGKRLHMSPERVRQIETRALIKMRRLAKTHAKTKELKYYAK